MADLLAELSKALMTNGAETVPNGWKTVSELAAESGKSICRAGEIVRAAVRAGLLEQRTFRISAGNRVCAIKHFRKVGT